MLQILDYHLLSDKGIWLRQIRSGNWRAAPFLADLLQADRFYAYLGEKSKLLLLAEGENLVSFCVYAERDEIPDPELTPWVGFVYTFPEYRGKRRVGKLLEHAYLLAKADGFPCLYLSTEEVGLYEKYGFTFWKSMKTRHGEDTRVYRIPIVQMDYSALWGTTVSGFVDRPLGTSHPRHPEMVYPINYGYVSGVFAGDGAEQDVYLFGTDQPLQAFTGKVAGVIHRLNDCEDKWIVSLDGTVPSRGEILEKTAFQEQYFMGELYLPE